MKKSLLVLLVLVVACATLIAQPVSEKQQLSVMALKGPTGMGLSKLMQDNENTNDYQIEIVGAVDEITARLARKEVDIAAVPANMASILYNKMKGEVQVLCVHTLGVLHIVTKNVEINSVEDLKGKTIYSSGKGATPEYSLNFILEKNGIDPSKDVQIVYKSEHTEVVAALVSSDSAIAMLPEPFVTNAMNQDSQVKLALDLTKEWEKITDSSSLITGVMIVRKEVAENQKEAVNAFLDAYQSSIEYVNANVEDAAKIIGSYSIVPEAVAKKAIGRCNIVFIEGSSMAKLLDGYLKELFLQNPTSVGGVIPDANFYYSR